MQYIATSENLLAASALPIELDSSVQVSDIGNSAQFKQVLSDAETNAQGELLNYSVEPVSEDKIAQSPQLNPSTAQATRQDAQAQTNAEADLADQRDVEQEADLVAFVDSVISEISHTPSLANRAVVTSTVNSVNEEAIHPAFSAASETLSYVADQTDTLPTAIAETNFSRGGASVSGQSFSIDLQLEVEDLPDAGGEADLESFRRQLVIPLLNSNHVIQANASERISDDQQVILSADEVSAIQSALNGDSVSADEQAHIRQLAQDLVQVITPPTVQNGLGDTQSRQLELEQTNGGIAQISPELLEEINADVVEPVTDPTSLLEQAPQLSILNNAGSITSTRSVDEPAQTEEHALADTVVPIVTAENQTLELDSQGINPQTNTDESLASIPAIEESESVALLNQLFTLPDLNNQAPITQQPPQILPQTSDNNIELVNTALPQNPLQSFELNEQQVEAVVENILSIVPESAQRTALASALRTDINTSASLNATPPLQDIVEQLVTAEELDLPEDLQTGLSAQATRAENIVAIAQSVIEGVVRQQNNASSSLPVNEQTYEGAETRIISGLEHAAGEHIVQTSEQSKLQQSASADRALPIHTPEGQKQVAEKIRWMVGARIAAAEIRLDPPELGSMQIRINMTGDTASVNFVVQSSQARDLLADAQPRLRDMLSEQGIDLGESFVSTQDEHAASEGEENSANGQTNLFASEQTDEVMVKEQAIKAKQSPYNVDAYV